jgi:hypothetical protein
MPTTATTIISSTSVNPKSPLDDGLLALNGRDATALSRYDAKASTRLDLSEAAVMKKETKADRWQVLVFS